MGCTIVFLPTDGRMRFVSFADPNQMLFINIFADQPSDVKRGFTDQQYDANL
jgi:hypothetical protein